MLDVEEDSPCRSHVPPPERTSPAVPECNHPSYVRLTSTSLNGSPASPVCAVSAQEQQTSFGSLGRSERTGTHGPVCFSSRFSAKQTASAGDMTMAEGDQGLGSKIDIGYADEAEHRNATV